MKQIILAVILLFSSMSIFVEQDVPFLTTKNYDEHVSQDGVVAVEFWAEWNSEESYNLCDLENVKAYRVDVDEEYMLVSRFRVTMCLPFLYIKTVYCDIKKLAMSLLKRGHT